MKLIVFYTKMLKCFLRMNKTASIVMFVSISLILLSNMYYVNSIMSYKSIISGFYRMRTIECTYTLQQSQSDFLDLPKKVLAERKDSIENIVFRYENNEIIQSIESSLLSSYSKERIDWYAPVNFDIVSYYNNNLNDERINSGQNINRLHEKNNDNVIVYNKSIYTEILKEDGYTIAIPDVYKVGDVINIMNEEYRIIGIMNNFGYSMIPYTTGLKNLKLKSIDINLKENLTDEHKRLLSEFIEREYPGLDVSPPPKIDQELFRKVSFGLFLLGVSCFLGLSYMLYIYKYIIESNNRLLIITRMLGLSTKKSIRMILFQVFMINTSVYIAIVLLYRYVIINVFSLYIPNTVFFIIIYLFVVIVSSLIIYPFAKRTCDSIRSGREVGSV